MNLQGIRYAVRSLIFDRGVSAIVIACLALGIGVNATLFSVVDGILIQPLPYAEADRLLILTETFERGGIRDAGVAYREPPRLESPRHVVHHDCRLARHQHLALRHG